MRAKIKLRKIKMKFNSVLRIGTVATIGSEFLLSVNSPGVKCDAYPPEIGHVCLWKCTFGVEAERLVGTIADGP